MKKLILSIAVVLGVTGVVIARQYAVPSANTRQPASIEYGGVETSSSAFSTNHATITLNGKVTIQSVRYSSGSVFDFVDVWDSTATLRNGDAPAFRFYNNNVISTATVSTLGQGESQGNYPVRLHKGAIWKPSASTYNSIHVLFYRD